MRQLACLSTSRLALLSFLTPLPEESGPRPHANQEAKAKKAGGWWLQRAQGPLDSALGARITEPGKGRLAVPSEDNPQVGDTAVGGWGWGALPTARNAP